MNRACNFLTGAGLGATVAYLFDPIIGNRRRSLLLDQFNHSLHKVSHAADVTVRDIRNRAYGTFAEIRGSIAGGGDGASDDVVVSRVRSKLGRYTTHASAIEVDAHDGIVTLRGPILAPEVDELVCAAKSVRGVSEVVNQLDVHDSAENIAALQGGGSPRGEPAELMQTYWAPTTRLAAGALGGALMLNCLTRRTPTSILFGTAGFGLFLRALTNLESKRLLGVRGRRGIDVRKTILINRPVEDVFCPPPAMLPASRIE
jgi:hypothetical protein